MSFRDDDETVQLVPGKYIHETPHAYLLAFDTDKFWIPKSQILSLEEEINKYGEQIFEVEIPEWLALEKGLDGYIRD